MSDGTNSGKTMLKNLAVCLGGKWPVKCFIVFSTIIYFAFARSIGALSWYKWLWSLHYIFFEFYSSCFSFATIISIVHVFVLNYISLP